MEQKYEYKFIRLGKGFVAPRGDAMELCRDTVEKYAKEGWRLVQIFSPIFGIYGWSRYYEVILEKEISN